MPWVLQGTYPAPQKGDDRWAGYPLQPGANVGGYGFRIPPPTPPYPPSWQIGGLWAIAQITDGVGVLGPISRFSVYYSDDVPTITGIGASSVLDLPGSTSGYFLILSLNGWIPVRSVEIWQLLVS